MRKSLRFKVLERDAFTCRYCGQSAPRALLEVDHAYPLSLGGSDDLSNLVTACFDCNRGKSARVLAGCLPNEPQPVFMDDWSTHVQLPCRLQSFVYDGLLEIIDVVVYVGFLEACDPRTRIWSGAPVTVFPFLKPAILSASLTRLQQHLFFECRKETAPSRRVRIRLLDFFANQVPAA